MKNNDLYRHKQVDKLWDDKTILLVDNNKSNLFLLQEIFKITKCRIILATNGIDAINHCKNNKDINIVLTELFLPKLNGYEAIKQIKKLKKDLPIIVQTSHVLDNAKEKCMELGCSGFIEKPYCLWEVLRKIDTLLRSI